MQPDDVATLALGSRARHTPQVVGMGFCTLCKWEWTFVTDQHMCIPCTDDQEWAILNRRFCNWLHRGDML